MKMDVKKFANAIVGLISMVVTIMMAGRLWGWEGVGLAVGGIMYASTLGNEIMWRNE